MQCLINNIKSDLIDGVHPLQYQNMKKIISFKKFFQINKIILGNFKTPL